jgi:transglutaminase-like putative cysteine protease
MVQLCDATVDHLYSSYTQTGVRYERGARPELERYVEQATGGFADVEDRVTAIARLCANIAATSPAEELDSVFGGSEEEILRRKTDWCVDLARAACALYQVANLPARLVILADTSHAYSGHQIVEVHRSGRWGAVDPATDVVYRWPDGSPASTRDLMSHSELARAHNRGDATPYTHPGQFRFAAIVNYFIWEAERYNYAVSGLNDYLHLNTHDGPKRLAWRPTVAPW